MEFVKNGILYSIDYKDIKIKFPLISNSKLVKKLLRSEEYEIIQLWEEIWNRGLLLEKDNNTYFIQYENLYLISDEDKKKMGLPYQSISLKLEESGNLGTENYFIQWFGMINGVILYTLRRHGNVILSGNEIFLLKKNQWDLIEHIEGYHDKKDVISRALFFSQIKKQSNVGNVYISSQMKEREYYSVENLDIDFQVQNPKQIKFQVNSREIPDKFHKKINSTKKTSYIKGDNNEIIFLSPKAQKQKEQILNIPEIKNDDVPKFIQNPLKYFPENLELDMDLFAERVKGIKIRTGKVVPTIDIQKSEDEQGWFDVEISCKVEIGDEQKEILLEEMKKITDGCSDDEYIYYNDAWIRVDSDKISETINEMKNLPKRIKQNDFSKKISKILDIYDNVDIIGYQEEIKQDDNRWKKYAIPKSVNAELRSYQKEGYYFIRRQNDIRTGCLLADDMGLGKTIQVITFLASKLEKNRNLKILIVMPKILLENWNNELNKFIPTLIEDNVYIHQGAKREKQREKLMDYTFVLTTYETLARDQVLLGSILWNIMICDEVQKIKNFNTLAASAVKGMNTEFKIAMTGTPVENRLSDLWSIVDYILPGYLSSYSEFKKNYEIPIGNRDIEAENELIQKLNPIFFRRMKEEVLIQELPQKHEEKLYVSAVSAERRMYQEILQEYKEQEKKEPLKALNNLIMASSHPQLVRNERTSDRKLVKESSKLNRTIRLLNQIKFKGEKVLIFTRYREMQKILQRIIYAKFKILPSIINGQMAAGMDKYEVIKEFERVKGFNVLILSPKAAGVGLTITAANHVIHYTREWNPAIENQATDRIYRIGQKKEVHVYYLITEYEDIYTVDRKLDNLLEYKKELLRRIIVPENLTVTENDLLEVIGF